MEFSASYADGLQIEVINTQDNTWSGTVVDTTTGTRVHIGSWTLPGDAGITGIIGSASGFVDNELLASWISACLKYQCKTFPCTRFPYTSIVFGVPTTSTSGAIGSLGDAYESGFADCKGKIAFKTQRTSDNGVKVSVGF